MKKYCVITLALVLTTVLLVGCGCTNRNMDNTSAPTVLPTNEEVWTNVPTTDATRVPTSNATMPDDTHETTKATIDHGNGPLDDTTAVTENTVEGRSRSGMLNQN